MMWPYALFLEKGYSDTSTSDVCRTAGISKPSLYHFFKSKRHLFFSCHMRSIDQTLKPFLDEASAIADPDRRIRFMIRDFTKMICKNPELKVLIHETMTIKDQYFKKIRDVWKEHYLLLKATIGELQDKRIDCYGSQTLQSNSFSSGHDDVDHLLVRL